jgi:hypothetical protein
VRTQDHSGFDDAAIDGGYFIVINETGETG